MSPPDWEPVAQVPSTYRLAVPGGWIYYIEAAGFRDGLTAVFVPAPGPRTVGKDGGLLYFGEVPL